MARLIDADLLVKQFENEDTTLYKAAEEFKLYTDIKVITS